MRGSPLLRAFVALAVLLVLGFPLHRLLRADDAPSTSSTTTAAPPISPQAPTGPSLHLQVSFTTPPSSFQVISLGQPVWQESAPTPEMQCDLPLPFPAEGIELQFTATWPAEVKAAARVRLTDPLGVSYERVVWAMGETSTVLSFP